MLDSVTIEVKEYFKHDKFSYVTMPSQVTTYPVLILKQVFIIVETSIQTYEDFWFFVFLILLQVTVFAMLLGYCLQSVACRCSLQTDISIPQSEIGLRDQNVRLPRLEISPISQRK